MTPLEMPHWGISSWVLLGLGLLLFPDVAIPFWPWPMTTLMLRVFAAWFTAFGAGLLWFLVERAGAAVAGVTARWRPAARDAGRSRAGSGRAGPRG